MRDAHQSLLATRLRTKDMVTAGPYLARHAPGPVLAWRLGAAQLLTWPCAS